jgi:hypothetical protein
MEDNVVDIAVREETTKARDPKKDQTGHDNLGLGGRQGKELNEKIEVDPGTKLQQPEKRPKISGHDGQDSRKRKLAQTEKVS